MDLKLKRVILQDGYDWGRLNLQSVTEEDSYQDFLNTAELAGREFDAEKWNIKLVDAQTRQARLIFVWHGEAPVSRPPLHFAGTLYQNGPPSNINSCKFGCCLPVPVHSPVAPRPQ